MSNRLFPSVDGYIIDTNTFVVFERHNAIPLLKRAVTEHNIVLLIPQRVYEELTPEHLPYDQPPVDEAIDDGWVQVVDAIEYANPVVSSTMDLVRRYIAAASEKSEHEVEQADAEVGGAAATLLENETAESIAVYTNDKAAFRGIERALSEHGYKNRVQFVKAFEFFDRIQDRYTFQN